MNKKLLPWFSLFFLTATPISLSATSLQTENAEGKIIKKVQIRIESNDVNSGKTQSVKSSLNSQEGKRFHLSQLDEDLKKLSKEYDYVDPDLVVEDGEVVLHIAVRPKPVITEINFIGNSRIKTRKLKNTLNVHPGSVLDRQEFNKQFNELQALYVKKGGYEAELYYDINVDKESGNATINIHIDEGNSGTIGRIFYHGLSPQERQGVRPQMMIRSYNLLSFMSGHGYYKDEMIEHDEIIINQYLQNRGYASAKTSIEIIPSDIDGKIDIKIDVDKGPLYHFDSVSFSGNTLFTDEQVEKQLLIKSGDTFSGEKVRETTESIEYLYGRKGYIDASAVADTTPIPGKNKYSVQFHIEEGGCYKIGMVHVVGNVSTQTRVILRESLLNPGEKFDSARLKATEQKLENIGYFKSVNVYAVRTKDNSGLGEDFRDVYIEVEEGSTGSFSLFIGASSSDDVSGGLDLAENNFNIRGVPKLFTEGVSALRGGGEFAHAKANFGKKQRSYTVSWMDPYFKDSQWRVGCELSRSYSHVTSNDFRFANWGATAYASHPINQFLTFGLKYRFKDTDVQIRSAGKTNRKGLVEKSNGPNSTPEEKEVVKAAEKQLAAFEKTLNTDGITSTAGCSLIFDSTNSAWKPTRGLRSVADFEYTGLGGKFNFMRLSSLNTAYFSPWRRGTFKARGEVKFIVPQGKTHNAEDIPASEKYYLGGDSTIRGFRDYKLGPRVGDDKDEPAGGISYFLCSFEYLHRLLPIVDLYGFVDAGSLSDITFKSRSFRASAGGGLRIELLNNVPFILGWGFPFRKKEKDDIEKFFFSMGAQF